MVLVATHHSELSKSSTIQVLEARGSIVFDTSCNWQMHLAEKDMESFLSNEAGRNGRTFLSLPFLNLFLPSLPRVGASPEEIGARTKEAKRNGDGDTVTIGEDNALISVRCMGSLKLLEEILYNLGYYYYRIWFSNRSYH